MEKELLFLEPVFKETIWGGKKLGERFGYAIPSGRTGECWAIGAHPHGDCQVLRGTWQGARLSQLWKDHPELFGNTDGRLGDQFPLLVKLIDAREDLSIQVHPDDTYAARQEKGALGKTECWYILDCEPGASIIIGHHARDQKELQEMVEGERWDELLRQVPVEKGDFFQIDPGCVHAIKGGILLLETQQSSDITYRLYDYGRLWNGSLRQLHLAQCMDVVRAPFVPPADQRKRLGTEVVDKEHLVTCSCYTVEKYQVHGSWRHRFTGAFVNVTVIEGEGTIDQIPIQKGMSFIIPAGYKICCLEGELSLICSWVPEPGTDPVPSVDPALGTSPVPVVDPALGTVPAAALRSATGPVPGDDHECPGSCISLEAIDWMGRVKAGDTDPDQAILAFEDVYEEGDQIRIRVPQTDRHYVIRIDGAMEEALVYMTRKELLYRIPFGEKKKSYGTQPFGGDRHYCSVRPAEEDEVRRRRNLAQNVMDQHGDHGCFPHASANVETRGESVFAARNAIDGILANRSHGSWPYSSWGINRQKDAWLLLDFGRPVDIDEIVLWTRADFPHDNWWEQARLQFSDGSEELIRMEKSRKPHRFAIVKKAITWIRLADLVQSEDPSPFPALTQIQVFGRDI